jgi:thioredoxin 1
MTIEITDSNFEEIVLKSDKIVIVDFWAEWCGPCKMIGPIISELADEYKDKIVACRLDVDNNPATSAKFGIRSIPTVLLFKNGEAVDKQIGAVPKKMIKDKIEVLL